MVKQFKKYISSCMALMLAIQLSPVIQAASEVNIVTINGGAAAVGNTLKAEMAGDFSDVSYQWYADGVAIDGAINQEFVPTYEQFGKSIKCVITDEGGTKESEDVALTSAFDEYKDTSWNLMSSVSLGTSTGLGDSSWDFKMQNEYGKDLSYTLLDIQNNKSSKYYVIANDYYNLYKNTGGTDTVYNPSVEGTVAYAADKNFVGKTNAEYDFPNAIADSIDKDHVWITEKDKAGKIPNPYTFKAGVTVPAIWEITEYIDKIKLDVRKSDEVASKKSMWLRTAYNDKNYHGINSSSGNLISTASGGNNQFKLSMMGASSGEGYIRPQFFLADDFFKKAKIDLETAGSNVLKEISKYHYDVLSGIYTDAEIEMYLPDIEGAGKKMTLIISTTDNKAATVGNTVKAVAKNSQGNVSYQWYANGEPIEGETSDTLIITYDYFEKKILCTANDGVNESTSNALSVTSDFDKHKDTSWANLTAVTLGTSKVGFGNKDWEFEMQNGYGQNLNFSLLKVDNNKKSKFYVLANDYYGVAYNNPTNNTDVVDAIYNPQMEGTVAYNINTNLMKKDGSKNTLPEAIVDAIDTDHVWITEKDNDKYISAPFTVKAGITTSAVWEIREYADRVKVDIRKDTEILEQIQAWLRSPLKHNHYLAVGVNPSGDGNKYEDLVLLSAMTNNYYFKVNGLHISNSRGYLRPQFYLNEDFFLNAKIDLTKAGKGVIKTLSEEYTREELLAVYTEAELEAAGLGTNYGIDVVWKSGNSTITSLDGVQTLSVNVSLTNTLSEDKKCIVIMSLYDENGKVIKMTAKDITINKNSTTDPIVMNLSDLSGVTDDYKAEVYVWDDLYNMNSLTKSEQI